MKRFNSERNIHVTSGFCQITKKADQILKMAGLFYIPCIVPTTEIDSTLCNHSY